MAIQGYSQIMYIDTAADLPSSAMKGQLAMDVATMSTYAFDGTSWAPLGRYLVKRSAVTVNGKSTGATKIYTLEPMTLKFYVVDVIPRVVSVSGVTTGPTVSIGTNSPSYNNIATGSLLPTILNALGVGSGTPQRASASIPLDGGAEIWANVSVGAIATNYSIIYDIVGYYAAN